MASLVKKAAAADSTTNMKHLAIFSFLLIALSVFGQGTVRRADTLLQVLTVNPTNFGVAEKLSYITAGRTSILDGDALFVNYERTNNLATNTTTRFGTLANTGRWVVTSLTPLSGPSLTNYFSFLAGSNMQVTVTSNSVTYAMTNVTGSGSGGGTTFVNGSPITNVNFLDSAYTKLLASGVTNVTVYITNYFSWEGIPVSAGRPNLKDGAYTFWTLAGSNLTAGIVEGSIDLDRLADMNKGLIGRYTNVFGVPQYISIGANLLLDETNGVLSAIIGTSATNGTPLSVDAGGIMVEANLQDSAEVNVTASGTNISHALIDGSIATNRVNTAFLNLLLNQYRINNFTNTFLSITNSASVTWATNANGDWTATASGGGGGSGSGTNIFVNGVLIQPAYLTNSAEVFISTNANGHIVFDVNDWDGFWSDLTNSLVASNNIAFAYDTANNKLMISAITSGGTGTAVTVDGGADLTRANFADASTTGLFDISGTNITFRLPDRDFGSVTVSSSGATITLDDGTVTSNKIVAANVTIDKLSATGTPLSTNFLAGDYSWKQITTNMIPGLVADILSAATNGPAGGGGTAVFVNGTSISNPNFTNSSTVLFSVSNATNITATVTNVAGSTTSNVVQRTGTALFRTTASAITDTNYTGVITDLTHNSGDSMNRMVMQVTLTGVTSTNYLVGVEIFDSNSPGTPAVWDVTEKTSSGFKINSSVFDASAQPNGYWYRIWVLDTVTVGGSGGDVISTANNTFTGTNTFSAPIIFGGQTRTNWPIVGEREDAVWYTEFSAPQGESAVRFGLPYGGLAIGSGATAAVGADSGGAAVQGYVRIPASTTINSGYAYLTSITGMLLTTNCVFEWQFRPQATNNSVVTSRYGWLDSASSTPTDGLYCERDGMNLSLIARNNSVSTTSATTYSIASNTWYYGQIATALVGSDVIATMRIWDSTPTLLSTISITNGLPTASGRDTGAGMRASSANNVTINLDDISMMMTIMPLRR